MNETNPVELTKALAEYRERYGNITIDTNKLEAIIKELREKKSD